MSALRRGSSTDASGWSPLLRQYFSVKSQHPNDVLLFRMGDFWETFFDDAATLSRVLGIALTTRGVEKGEPVPLAGVPLANLESTVRKLVAAGHRVAICDQVEDPKFAKGLVKREVVEVVSAGTISLPGLLDERVGRFLVAVAIDSDAGRAGLARTEISTGELGAVEIAAASLDEELERIGPSEILVTEGASARRFRGPEGRDLVVTRLAAFPSIDEAARAIREGPGFAPGAESAALFQPLALRAAGALLQYLDSQRKAERSELSPLEFDATGDAMVLDEITLRNLEILRAPFAEGTAGSLLSALDRTRTPMGARLLRRWLVRPLLSPERIAARQSAVEALVTDDDFRGAVEATLAEMGDVERIAVRVGAGRAHARDLVALATSLARLPALEALLARRPESIFAKLAASFGNFETEVETIQESFAEAPPLGVKDGGLFRDGVSAELDRLRDLSRGAKDWIARLQAAERERTGIGNLKIGYNRVFGYYLEVTRGNKEAVPADYERRQTLAGAERYVTPALKEREAEILGADERARALELEMFLEIRGRIGLRSGEMRRAAGSVAALDALMSLAETARRGAWVRPIVDDSGRLEIHGGRHPVVEVALPAGEFVPNDALLDVDSRQILLVTGPNMAGKSTYLRQVAVLCILAQTGSFVPATSARLGVVDRVFTRVGAADAVLRGHSTFMVEMIEVSRILSSATRRSLLLLDEVGRGTSTYDGLAIAWAVVEHLHETPERAARTLFATHYHELTQLADRLERARNLRVTVHEWKDDIVFLRKIVEGAADRSFGIQVAKLAGIPESVTRRAKKILAELERGSFLAERANGAGAGAGQLDLFSRAGASVLAELGALDPQSMTPLEALAVLHEWKRRASETGDA